jgi:GT2 family glycosyltransferase
VVLDNCAGGRIGVIVINYCGLTATIACIDSVLASSYKNFTVYILDNASPDGSGTDLETYNEQYHVLVRVLDSNIGFGAANNIGAEHAFRDGCAYALLLNNDTVIDADTISVLHAKSANKKVTVPLMYYYSRPSTIWYRVGYFDVFGIPRHRFTGVSDALELHEEDVRFATGCCI